MRRLGNKGVYTAGACLVALMIFSVALAPAASAQYYKGKTVTLLINFSAGGATDVAGRVVGKYLGRHVPGNPRIIVRNMPGAGGLIATNHMGTKAPKDGTTVAFMVVVTTYSFLNDPALRVSFDKFNWMGGFMNPQICYIRTDVAPGMKKPADIARAVPFKTGGLRKTSSLDLRILLSLDLMGVKYKHVAGHKGVAKIRQALLQNEVQYSCVTIPGYRANVEPTLIKTGQGIPVWYYPLTDGKGGFEKSDRTGDVPSYIDVFQQVHGKGKIPTGIKARSLWLINDLATAMQRGMFLPPGTNPAAVTAMQTGFDKLVKDPEFIAAYTKVSKAPPQTLNAATAVKQMAKLKKVDPEIVAFLRKYVGFKPRKKK